MITLLETAQGHVRVQWQGFDYELGPALARLNAAKLTELGSLPGRLGGLGLVKCKFAMLSRGGAEYRVEWTGTKDQALALAAGLLIRATEADQQRAALKLQKQAAEDELKRALLCRLEATGGKTGEGGHG